MTVFLLIFFLLLVTYGLLIDYYRRSWNSIPVFMVDESEPVKISVVVAVRDEEKNIVRLIECLRQQHYPSEMFEVIIIDDHSADNTVAFIERSGAGFIVLELPPGVSSKKRAVEAGVQAARGELIVTTDADCVMGPAWLSTIAGFYRTTGAKFIAAPVQMHAQRSLLGFFQCLDFLTLQGITGASVHRRFHMMCNGANLAYTKSSFLSVNGFEGIDDIPSGDDMLLMHKVYMTDASCVRYLKSSSAAVHTNAELTWKAFFHQRIRWASKAVHYKDRRIVYVLILVYMLNISFVVLAGAAVIDTKWLMFVLLFFAAKVLIEFPFVNSVAIFFRQQSLMKYFIFFQPLHIVYTIIAGWLGRFGSYRWKSRTIKNKPAMKPVKL